MNRQWPPSLDDDVERAITKLISLRDGPDGVVETIACGQRAVPALRRLLFEREPSGIYQPRCCVVAALAGLRARDALIEFLKNCREVSDPVERTGEDAVINAAARALIGWDDELAFPVLLAITKARLLAGVIEALGTMRRIAALPYFIAALLEDSVRPEAEAAILQLGPRTRPALLRAAVECVPSEEDESVSSLRRRRSVLGLLLVLGVRSARLWRPLQPLMHASDARLAVLTCKICLAGGQDFPKLRVVHRLIELLGCADWIIDQEIEDCLVDHSGVAIEAVQVAVRSGPEATPDSPDWRRMRTLKNVMERLRPSGHTICALDGSRPGGN